jgi:DNA polymerase V
VESAESTCPFLSGEGVSRPLDLNELIIKNPPATYFVRMASDSMVEAGIHAGDILVVDRSLPATAGKMVVAVSHGELELRFAPHKEDIQVWGVVTYVIHKC